MKINEIESVDKVAIRKLLVKHFKLYSDVTIDSNGLVSTDDSVFLSISHKLNKLPVKFLHVSGSFECYGNNLITLEGCPQTVGKYFECGFNRLTSLEHSPKIIGEYYSCNDNPLVTLAGIPDHMSTLFLSYDPQLPLMRSLVAYKVKFLHANMENDPNHLQIEQVLNKYAGQGKAGMMKCASELLSLGKQLGLDLRQNARW